MQSTLHPGLAYKQGRDQVSRMYEYMLIPCEFFHVIDEMGSLCEFRTFHGVHSVDDVSLTVCTKFIGFNSVIRDSESTESLVSL